MRTLRNIIYNLFLILPINKNLVLLDSNNGNEFEGNILALYPEIKKEKKVFIGSLNYKKYNKIYNSSDFISMRSLKYIYLLACSKYIFTDTSLPTYYKKKKRQILINTWHGTPLKKMGFDIKKKGYKLSVNVQKNLILSDYIFLSNEYSKEIFENSYCLDGRDITILPSPRNSKLLKTKEERNNNRILFMPTWRDTSEENNKVLKRIESIIEKLPIEFEVFVKIHPIVEKEYKEKYNFNYLKTNDLYQSLNDIDILVTDYSSIMFDFAILNRKIILDIFDIKEYETKRGLYFDVRKLPFLKSYSVDEIVDLIKKDIEIDYSKFNEKFNYLDNNKGTTEVLKFLKNKKRKRHEKNLESYLCVDTKKDFDYKKLDDLRNSGKKIRVK